MAQTLIIIPAIVVSTLNINQKDFAIKSGFVMGADGTFIRNVSNTILHIVIGQLSSKAIGFNLKIINENYSSKPCSGCKR